MTSDGYWVQVSAELTGSFVELLASSRDNGTAGPALRGALRPL